VAALGCAADYSAFIADRDGSIITEAAELTEVEWYRLLNDTSTGRVVINPDGDCCGRIGKVRTWRSYLHIYRNSTYVWGGPILSADWRQGGFEVFAGDILAWLARRVPHETITFTSSDLTDIASWLIRDAFLPDDPGHTVEVLGKSGVTGKRSYSQDIGQTLDHLKDLADTGMDFTAVGNKILLLPDEWSASVGSLTDEDMPEGLVVSEDGTALATRWIVYGSDGSGIKGTAGGAHPYYGLLERSVQQTSIEDNASAEAAARSRLNASLPVPVYIDTQEVTLSPEAAVDVSHLIPGWCVDLSTTATCRNISQRMKISGLHVEVDGDGESVKVQLAPATSRED
jgi:hypothetical protein